MYEEIANVLEDYDHVSVCVMKTQDRPLVPSTVVIQIFQAVLAAIRRLLDAKIKTTVRTWMLFCPLLLVLRWKCIVFDP